MSHGHLASDVLSVFPEASISIDDGESLRFRVTGFICGGRRLATGKWCVEVRDVRSVPYEVADELGASNKASHDIVPALKRLLDSLALARPHPLPNF